MTIPAKEEDQPDSYEATERHLIIAPSVRDEKTSATFVHKDYVKVSEAFEYEGHIPPVEADERFGDVDSWVNYLQLYGDPENTFITWSDAGLSAVLDYHARIDNSLPAGASRAQRAAWRASCPFVLTPEFRAWNAVADGHAIEHRKFVEFLEDHAPDIFEPDQAALLDLLRTLRGNVNATADASLRPDGTSDVRFEKSTSVQTGGASMALPPEITITVPVLRGHVDENGVPVRYKLVLKLRVTVGDGAHLAFRLVMPQAEIVLEQVYAERVAEAETLLGQSFTVLRAAG